MRNHHKHDDGQSQEASVPTPGSTIEPDTSPLEDKTTSAAIDDIAAKESDEVLAAEDAALAKNLEPKKQGLKQKLKDFLRSWWENKKARYATLIGLAVVVIALFAIPTTRYFLLNEASVRGSASVTVLDDSTQLPLKNIAVSAAGITAQTDGNGKATLSHIKLGSTILSIKKRAFATLSKPVTIGWGSNPLGKVSIKAVGSQYVFLIKDWLSSKPITKAEASSGDASAISDGNGKVTLTVDTSDNETSIPVTITSDSYRSEKLTLNVNTTAAQTVTMVPSRQSIFISNRTGKYGLYKVDIDGKNEKLVLAGTGSEEPSMVLLPHPTDNEVAYVSTRENVHDSGGFLLTTLTMVDLDTDVALNVAQSEQIQLVGWVGTKLVYVQIAAGASAANSKRFRLITYDYKTGDKVEIASANSFNDVILIGSTIYYAPSSLFSNDPNAGFIKSSVDGKTKNTLLSQETWNIFRVSYSTLDLSVGQDWYQYNLGDTEPTKLTNGPANPTSRLYVDSPDGKHSLWVDQRDGKGVLISYDTATKKETTLQSVSNLQYPVRWLTDSVVIYRISSNTGTADYALSINGGNARKIRDVVNTAGLNLWYYY